MAFDSVGRGLFAAAGYRPFALLLDRPALALYSHGDVGDDRRSNVVSRPQMRRIKMRREFLVAAAVAVLALSSCASLRAQQTSALSAAAPAAAQHTETDEYTRYELLAPETASFKISYEVTATTPGAKFFYNPIRKGSSASDESVFDTMTGGPLHFEVVSGAEARKDALMSEADAD